MIGLIKEIFIFALLFMVIMFTLGILFYDHIPTNKTVPKPITYIAEGVVTSTLQEIAESRDQSINIDTNMEPEWSYSISSSDLQSFASKKSYTSGKVDPFAEYVEEETVEGEEGSGESSTSQTGESSTKNSSTGTYFESSSSK